MSVLKKFRNFICWKRLKLPKTSRKIHSKNDLALIYASRRGHLNIVKYLVKKGKRVIIKDNSTNLLEVKKEYGNMFIYQKKDV